MIVSILIVRVLITTVNKVTSKPELHIFNNCFHNQFSNGNTEILSCHVPIYLQYVCFQIKEYVWKVARYTSAAPLYFTECDNYVDGGLLANNPCDVGLTAIQNYNRTRGVSKPIALVVSVGSGLCPGKQLGSTNVQEYFLLGRHWLNPEGLKERAKNLLLLIGNAVSVCLVLDY